MPQNQQFDAGEFKDFALPYDILRPDLSDSIRIVDGSDMMVNSAGKLSTRPGVFSPGALWGFSSTGRRIDAMEYVESIADPSIRFLVASVYDAGTGTWNIRYMSVSGGGSGWPGGWTAPQGGNYRNINSSTAPHQMGVSRGLVFIKGFPASGDKLCSAIFDPVDQRFKPWGILGPTEAAAVTVTGTASTYTFSVNYGWQYVYTWKDLAGHESNRSPLQTDPSKTPSNTGAFSSKIPQVVVQGNASTSDIPSVVIYRSTDGGGSFYKIDEIPNTGAGAITYLDKNYPDGLIAHVQPVPDTALDTTYISPSLTSNSPPPAVNSSPQFIGYLNASITASDTTMPLILNTTFYTYPSLPAFPFTTKIDNEYITVNSQVSLVGGVYTVNITRGANGTVPAAHAGSGAGIFVFYAPITGFDLPAPCSSMASYSGRIWYAIGNVLYYSANEELSIGIPECAFPSGARGNFYRFQNTVVSIQATNEALYIFTNKETWWLRGTSKDTFQLVKLFPDVGAAIGQPLARTALGSSVVWLTDNGRICMARGSNRDFISDPLGGVIQDTYLSNALSSTRTAIFQFAHYQTQEKDLFIMIATPDPANYQYAANGNGFTPSVFTYDFNQREDGGGLWNTPWTIPATAMCVGRLKNNDFGHLFFGIYAKYSGSYYGGLGVLTSIGASASLPIFSARSSVDCYYTGVFSGAGDTFANVTYAGINAHARLSLVRNPTGNHINALRLPAMDSTIYGIKLEIGTPATTYYSTPSVTSPVTSSTYDSNPTVEYLLDTGGVHASGTAAAPIPPPRRPQSTDYVTLIYPINKTCERVSVIIKAAGSTPIELQKLAYIWNPDTAV